jgi:hypothetical protein
MTTKVTDKGIIYPDGTEQTTAAYGSGGTPETPVDAYTKEETDNKFYDKEEIDSLLEGSSVAIVGNYTNKWASNVARDPGAGNLYLVAGMDFTMKFEDATRIYISNTDGDGALRDFDKVKVDDVLTVTSDNGQGVFKLLSISDLTGYRELVLEAESATGTVANDTPVSIVLDVASSGDTNDNLPKGSIIMWTKPEVPEGWQVCDGTNDTPDLRDKFVVGAGTTYDLDAEGGSKDAVVVSHKHTLSGSASSAGAHAHSIGTTEPYGGVGGNKNAFYWLGGGNTITNKNSNSGGAHTHSLSGNTSTVGSSATNANLPPYYALYYIIKMVDASGSGSSGGGIEEAPEDGKQYARKDAGWSEVEATSGGGDVEAQPPVAFNLQLTSSTTTSQGVNTPIALDKAVVDTDNGLKDGGYEVQKDGLYDISYTAKVTTSDGNLNDFFGNVYLNGNLVIQGSANPYRGGSAPTGGKGFSVSGSSILDLKKGDVITLELYTATSDSAGATVPSNALSLSGHMVSSFTEGSGGGSGGGTAEPMVWENKKAERAYDTVYTNTNDCPIYVQPYLERNSTERMYVQFKIDGDLVFTEGGESISFNSPLFVVPSGSTYELVNQVPGTALVEWFEANVSGGASSGGGSYTPEKMVWENKVTDRGFDTVFTNDNDVPLYLNISTQCTNANEYATMWLDGTSLGAEGNGAALSGKTFSQNTYIIPSGSTYELRATDKGTLAIGKWLEARMPVAVGSGGDSIWTEEDGKAVYNGTVDLGPVETEQKFNVYNFDSFPNNYSKFGFGGVPFYPRMYFPSDGNLQFGTMSKDGNDTFTNLMQLTNGGSVTTIADMWVNGIRVGQGGGATAQPESTVLGVDVLAANVSGSGNTGIGSNALRRNTSGYSNTAIGRNALTFVVEGANNTGVGSHALGACTGNGNTSIGESAGSATITGNNNTLIGSGAQPSSADVSNEVTIGNGSVTKTRLNGQVTISDNVTINTGELIVPDMTTTSESYNIPNCYISSGGQLVKHTSPSLYSIEEIDKKLAIKDKLIEKLSARLDELEKRVK